MLKCHKVLFWRHISYMLMTLLCFHLNFPPHHFSLLNSAMRETKEALENASAGLEVLQEGTGKLNFNLGLVRASINRTLNNPGCHDEDSDATSAQLCRNIRQSLSQLQISANFTRVQKHMFNTM